MSMIRSYPRSYSNGPRHLRPDDDSLPSFMPPYQSGTPEEEEELAMLQQLERGRAAHRPQWAEHATSQTMGPLGQLSAQNQPPLDELSHIEEQDEAADLLEPATKPSRSVRAAWFRDQVQTGRTTDPENDELPTLLAQGQEQNQIPRRPHAALENFVPGQSSPTPKPESGLPLKEDVAVDEPSRHGPAMRPRLDYIPVRPKPQDDTAAAAVPHDLDWSKASPNPKAKVPGVDGPGPGMTEQERGFAEIGENDNLDVLHELHEWNKAINAGRPVQDKPKPNSPQLPRRVTPSNADNGDNKKESVAGSDAKSVEAEKAPVAASSITSKSPTRKDLILGSLPGEVKIRQNPAAKSAAPGHEVATLGMGAVAHYDEDIAYAARIKGMDPDLIRAVMYMEMSHGWYDPSGLGVPYSLLPTSKSILPMNVNAQYWGEAFGSKADLSMSRVNVVSGAEMLRRIHKIAPGAGIAEIATLYNNVNADKVSAYGARVAQIYKDKPWEHLTKPVPEKAKVEKDQ